MYNTLFQGKQIMAGEAHVQVTFWPERESEDKALTLVCASWRGEQQDTYKDQRAGSQAAGSGSSGADTS